MKLFVDHLTVIDCSLLMPHCGLTGQSWIADLLLEGELDESSMVMDFGVVKKQIKIWIDDGPDHRLVCARGDDRMTIDHEDDTRIRLYYDDAHERRTTLTCPPQGVYLLDESAINATNLAAHLSKTITEKLSTQGIKARINLREEAIEGPRYRYSHGLKKHDGNCQRIAHGHRSRIEISRNGVRDEALMQAWAKAWQDIYLGSEEDIASRSDGQIHFAYDAPQGHFALSIAEERCCMLETDTTVECISDYIAATLKKRHPADNFTVRAYEGVHKGAISEA